MVQTIEVKEAKRRLFNLLLIEQRDTLTDNEIDIMFSLCQDKDIQEILQKAKELEVKRDNQMPKMQH